MLSNFGVRTFSKFAFIIIGTHEGFSEMDEGCDLWQVYTVADLGLELSSKGGVDV